ncbi:MAG: response regulator [Nonomuraea sp.]|nr:response regulator [Nonomuraea sp.]
MLRVLIADDQDLFRAGFGLILGAQPDMLVVGEAADGDEAIVLAGRLRPDVVLMDVRMPGKDGIEATREICATTSAKVLVLTMFDLDEYVYDAVRAGASGFLLKDIRRDELAHAVLRPGLATVAVFSALSCWNEFLLALLYIQDDSLKTIPTGLLAFSSRYVTDYGLLFSALSIITLPMIAVYVVFNRQVVSGITAGSLK